MELVAAAVDTASTSYQLGGWLGRLAVLLLVVLLVRKYVFKKEAPRLGRRRREGPPPAASMAGRPDVANAGVSAGWPAGESPGPADRAGSRTDGYASTNILPAPSAKRQRR